MKQLTIRGVEADLDRRLKHLSEERGESVNATVLAILAEAVGLDVRKERLARYATWTADDLCEFQKALAQQRTVDAKSWR
jgi:hypothetical protein